MKAIWFVALVGAACTTNDAVRDPQVDGGSDVALDGGSNSGSNGSDGGDSGVAPTDGGVMDAPYGNLCNTFDGHQCCDIRSPNQGCPAGQSCYAAGIR